MEWKRIRKFARRIFPRYSVSDKLTSVFHWRRQKLPSWQNVRKNPANQTVYSEPKKKLWNLRKSKSSSGWTIWTLKDWLNVETTPVGYTAYRLRRYLHESQTVGWRNKARARTLRILSKQTRHSNRPPTNGTLERISEANVTLVGNGHTAWFALNRMAHPIIRQSKSSHFKPSLNRPIDAPGIGFGNSVEIFPFHALKSITRGNKKNRTSCSFPMKEDKFSFSTGVRFLLSVRERLFKLRSSPGFPSPQVFG